jgi:dTDP-4-amino-4,6-dideoxygalactose transaminase
MRNAGSRPVTASKGHTSVDDAVKTACLGMLNSHEYYLGSENGGSEAEVAEMTGVREAIAVNSGASAMFLIPQAVGIGPGRILPEMRSSLPATPTRWRRRP